jgi:hypothetical protein
MTTGQAQKCAHVGCNCKLSQSERKPTTRRLRTRKPIRSLTLFASWQLMNRRYPRGDK